jgi:RES domain-containing protein
MEGLKYKMVVIEFPGQKGTVEIMDEKKLLPNWHLLQYRANTQKLGGVWYEQKSSVALKVPSAIIPYEFNFVLNTQHPGFSQVKIERLEDFNWDQRLL